MSRPAAVLALLLLAPLAAAQTAPPPEAHGDRRLEYVQGASEHGIRVFLDGVDLRNASHPRRALHVDPASSINISFQLAPPPNTTYQVSTIVIGLLLSAPTDDDPLVAQDIEWASVIPHGYTVYVNESHEMGRLKDLGAGMFRMQAAVRGADGETLYRESFYVRIEGNPLLTATGAIVTVASVATGYGLWQLLQDVKEAYEARKRHAAKRKAKKARKAPRLVATALEVREDAERLERRGLVKWSATGLGLGAVLLSWLQFLGYVAFNLVATVVTALGLAAAFLTAALVLAAATRRARAARTVSIPVQTGEVPARPPEAPAPEAAPTVESKP